jgi:hypothetical protein
MGKLAEAAHFWAMRLCEYAKVPKSEQRQTKQLCIRNIAFIIGKETLDHNSPSLHLVACVSVTFEQQKNDRTERPAPSLSGGHWTSFSAQLKFGHQ